MKWLTYGWMGLKALLATIPLVTTLIQTFETPGFGAEKKEKVLAALGIALEKLGITGRIKTLAVDFADWLIDSVVYIKNLSGEFKHEETQEES